MRKSFNGLEALVRNTLEQDPLSGHVFGFSNRRRNLMKLLVWDGSGLWVLAKRLPKGTFAWPKSGDEACELTKEELAMLIGGIDAKETTVRNWHRYKSAV